MPLLEWAMARTWLLLFLALRGQTLPTGKSLLPPSWLPLSHPLVPTEPLNDAGIHGHLVLRPHVLLQMECQQGLLSF